jgi:hypothetical protein
MTLKVSLNFKWITIKFLIKWWFLMPCSSECTFERVAFFIIFNFIRNHVTVMWIRWLPTPPLWKMVAAGVEPSCFFFFFFFEPFLYTQYNNVSCIISVNTLYNVEMIFTLLFFMKVKRKKMCTIIVKIISTSVNFVFFSFSFMHHTPFIFWKILFK